MEDGHLELFFPLKMVIFHSFLYVYHVGYPWIFFQGSQGFQGRINALKEGLRKRTKKKGGAMDRNQGVPGRMCGLKWKESWYVMMIYDDKLSSLENERPKMMIYIKSSTRWDYYQHISKSLNLLEGKKLRFPADFPLTSLFFQVVAQPPTSPPSRVLQQRWAQGGKLAPKKFHQDVWVLGATMPMPRI